jgi:ParB-like chromosome segregation protein Spo0J
MDAVEANTYNPNAVARTELGLLLRSIEADGYTQPIVGIEDTQRVTAGGNDVITTVDGFHRGAVMKAHPPLAEKYHGFLPVVLIEKDINDRMASTVRHNRARGKHSVDGMANMVFQMLDNGMTDADICNELGMEPEELVRLKHITGFAKLFENTAYSRSWKSRAQVLLEKSRQRRAQTPASQPVPPPADSGA